MAPMKIDGGCHCDRLTYEAEINLDKTGIYHCEDCKTFSKSEFRGFAAALPGTFRLTGVDPSRCVKPAANGNRNAMLFWPNCGIYICSTGAEPGAEVLRREMGHGATAQADPSYLLETSSAAPRMTGCGPSMHCRSIRPIRRSAGEHRVIDRIYPRRPFVCQRHATMIDQLLASNSSTSSARSKSNDPYRTAPALTAARLCASDEGRMSGPWEREWR